MANPGLEAILFILRGIIYPEVDPNRTRGDDMFDDKSVVFSIKL